jgi:hypothetical protein
MWPDEINPTFWRNIASIWMLFALRPSSWRQCVPFKYSFICMGLQDITSCKILFHIVIAVRTSNPAMSFLFDVVKQNCGGLVCLLFWDSRSICFQSNCYLTQSPYPIAALLSCMLNSCEKKAADENNNRKYSQYCSTYIS